jgi:hypothetical protein
MGATPRDIRFLADYLGLDLSATAQPVAPQQLYNPFLPHVLVTRKRGISTGAPGAPMMFNMASRRVGMHLTVTDGVAIPPPFPRASETPSHSPLAPDSPRSDHAGYTVYKAPPRSDSDKITMIAQLESRNGELVWVFIRYADDVQQFTLGTPHSIVITQSKEGGGDEELARIGLVNGHAKTTVNVSNRHAGDGTPLPSYAIPGMTSIPCTNSKSMWWLSM